MLNLNEMNKYSCHYTKGAKCFKNSKPSEEMCEHCQWYICATDYDRWRKIKKEHKEDEEDA